MKPVLQAVLSSFDIIVYELLIYVISGSYMVHLQELFRFKTSNILDHLGGSKLCLQLL